MTDNLELENNQEYLLTLLTEFVKTQQQIGVSVAQMSASVQALVSKEMSDYEPKFKRKLTEYADFDWSTIDAKPNSYDSDGFVSSVEYLGFVWTRRCSRDNDKFGNTIRFNRTKKGDGKDLEYLDLIAFSEKGATIDALSSSVLVIVKQSQKNKTNREPYNGSRQVTSSPPPALPSSSQKPIASPNSRPNVSYPLQPSSRPSSQATNDPAKAEKQAALGRLITDRGIPIDDVKAISMEKYGVNSSSQMNLEQIEGLYKHLNTVYVTNSVPLPG